MSDVSSSVVDGTCPPIQQTERAYKRMPLELWYMILSEVPSMTGRHAATAFCFPLGERHKKHSGIWDRILKDEEWTSYAQSQGLNPCLVGVNLYNLFKDPTSPARIELSTGDMTGSIRHHRAKLISSLRPHDMNEQHEIIFRESRIVLGISDALYNTFFTTLPPETLFFDDGDGQLHCACIYWKDKDYSLRKIDAQDIVGIGGRVATLKDVSLICGITFRYPREVTPQGTYQQRFLHEDCPPAYPLCATGQRYERHNILGWRWGDNFVL